MANSVMEISVNRAICLFSALLFLAFSQPSRADSVLIADDNFAKYFNQARPGDIFSIYPGRYRIKKQVVLEASGTKDLPIFVQPSGNGKVIIEVDSPVAFKIRGANWVFENIEFVGICDNHSRCEHALQIAGKADNTTVRKVKFVDFNAAIKGNGEIIDGRQYFPDNVLIEDNVIYNNTPRNTGNPVTPIDVVGGRNWVIRENFIADFAKGAGNKISYAAFLKGNSDHGLFERNLIICEWRHKGGARLGLSFGGGGVTNPNYCQGRSCKIEHYKGIIRGNIIMNCPNDVGIYLNNAASTEIINNTIINTAGIDVRFNGSFATIANNIIEGRIKDRDGGRFRQFGNVIVEDIKDIFPGADLYDLTPEDMDDLEEAAFGFEGRDFCTGKPLEDWVGAFSQPMACRIQDQLKQIGDER
ncbi:right-handed parallel beta-helix repeat-containing protein [Kordiimonas lacus]|uniref:Right handed beta helix region n=1 Tax=Kordiimonas lacus TaxID=637679 RepID=A0A1G6U9K3_9PROT|nr:right-handed parallel beta-helix repeat-containing protein [Kordiimonas lacus]SDD37235.1 Right handed beta helix region [Kordiimonas lacus]